MVRKLIVLLSLVLTLVLIFAACGDDRGSPAPGSQPHSSRERSEDSSDSGSDGGDSEGRSRSEREDMREDGFDSRLIGRWEFTSGDELNHLPINSGFEVFPDGTIVEYAAAQSRFRAEVNDEQLRFSPEPIGAAYVYNYSVSGDILTVTDETGSQAVFQRVTTAGGGADRPAGLPGIGGGGAQLIGVWKALYYIDYGYEEYENENIFLEFLSDGSFLQVHAEWGTQGGMWTSPAPGHLIVTEPYSEEEIILSYILVDDTLTLIFDEDFQIVMSRVRDLGEYRHITDSSVVHAASSADVRTVMMAGSVAGLSLSPPAMPDAGQILAELADGPGVRPGVYTLYFDGAVAIAGTLRAQDASPGDEVTAGDINGPWTAQVEVRVQ